MKTSKTVKNAYEITNLRQIRVKYIPPTNYTGSRVKIYEVRRYNDQQTQSKYFDYSYEHGDIAEQAFDILKRNGWHIVSRCSDVDNLIFLCNNWGDNYNEIKELK